MTWTIKSEHIKGRDAEYVISIEQTKYSTCYNVYLSRMLDDCRATIEKGYLYPTIEKANRRYSALKREIRKELET